MVPNQVEQFINEILILSQIKKKYVVKLLIYCLETEVTLLVYESIASQVDNVLSYLHDTIATPIIHRDMKSMNILLDESYRAKVTDFGASRLSVLDESQFATMVMGTQGYLDLEYMQAGKLTEKSDVYRFGVVFVELLTREKAISFERSKIEEYLAMHFLVKMRDGCLFNILDKNIVSDGTVEELQQVADLAKWCLNLKGEERPTMKEVAMELARIKRKGLHLWTDNGSIEEDCESLLAEYPRSDDYGGYVEALPLDQM